MKKILVLLLILAVAGGVFALDGEWGLSGMAEFGAIVNLEPNQAVVTSSTYNMPYGHYDDIMAQLGISYKWEALSLGVDLNYGGGVGGDLQYDGESYKFQAATNIFPGMAAGNFADIWGSRLWGYYELLNNMIHLEASYNGRQFSWWESDKSALSNPLWGMDGTFTDVDHEASLVANLQLENIQFGLMAQNFIVDGRTKVMGTKGTFHDAWFNMDGMNPRRQGLGLELIDDILKAMIFGVKFAMQPFEVAAQFEFASYGVYIGGKIGFGPVTVGLSFSGLLDGDEKPVSAGVNIEYGADAFGANLKGWFKYVKTGPSSNTTLIGIEPGFFYNVIPTHLRFQLDAGLYFAGGKTGGTKLTSDVDWAIQPQIFWNFLGTGAGGYYGGWNTGMILRYRITSMESDAGVKTNAVDVTFRFGF
jgi:hypothetical protein